MQPTQEERSVEYILLLILETKNKANMNKKKTFFTTLILLIMPLCCSLAQSAAVDYPMNYSMEFTRCFGMPGLNLSWGFDKPYEEARILVNDFNVNKNSDFDFNDLVFDAKFTSSGARLTVWAVGTTSPIKVGGREAHELFGVSTSTLINTKDMAHNAITFDIEGDYAGDFNNIEVEMQDENGDWHLLQSRRGDATTKLAVPTSVKWCMENENISKVYPDFSNYVFGYECNWWENYQGSQIAVETKRTIHVAQAGTLSSYISLTGEINGTDFKTIRRMLGAPSELDSQYYNYGYGWGNEDTKLRSLDISGARIVAGGTYIENHEDAACDLHLNESDIIPARVFDGCKNLVSIAIPDNVNFIGSFALRGTAWYDAQPDGLVYLGKVLYTYKGNDIPSKITIEDGTLGIAGDAFADQSIESVTIPESVTRIGDGEFYFGGDTTPGFRPLGKGAFAGCTRLKDVYCYAENVPDTKMNPFLGTDIESGILYVPAGSIDAYKAAEPWSNFKEILPIEGSSSSGSCGENLTWKYDEVTKALTISGTGEMDNYTLIGSPWYELRNSIQSLVIEDGVTTIGNCAFASCDGMTSVTIPNSITSIGSSAFWQSGITSFVINNNISRIEQSTFYGCHNLETLVIGRNVSFIGDGNFIFCGLKDIYCYAEDVPWAEKAFEGVEVDGSPDDITLHVAANSIKDYQSSYPWSNFKEIVALDASGIKSIEADNRVIQINSIRGERLEAPSKGINIIKMKDGTTKKILVK